MKDPLYRQRATLQKSLQRLANDMMKNILVEETMRRSNLALTGMATADLRVDPAVTTTLTVTDRQPRLLHRRAIQYQPSLVLGMQLFYQLLPNLVEVVEGQPIHDQDLVISPTVEHQRGVQVDLLLQTMSPAVLAPLTGVAARRMTHLRRMPLPFVPTTLLPRHIHVLSASTQSII